MIMKSLVQNKWHDVQTFLNTVVDRLTLQVTHPYTITVFRRCVYLYLLFFYLLYLPIATHMWGELSYSLPKTGPLSGSLDRFLDPLSQSTIAPYWTLFLGLQMTLLFIGILGHTSFIHSVLICYLNFALDNKAWVTLNGGNNIIQLMLVYMIAMRPYGSDGNWRYLRNGITNFAFYAALLQFVVVYSVAGLTKLQSNLWRNGVALYYVLNTDEFTTHFAQQHIATNDFLVMAGTYLTLSFQLAFPFLIWQKKIRPYLLAIGTFLHLQIAFVMGLLDFGFAMIICYFLFHSEETSRKILGYFQRRSPLHVAFDSGCLVCMKFARCVKFFDWNGLIVIDSALDSKHPKLKEVSLSRLRQSMHAIDQDSESLATGYESIYQIAIRLPILLPIVPIFKLFNYLNTGERIYSWVSEKSSWRQGCREGVCQILRK